jgi:hypothetical protein
VTPSHRSDSDGLVRLATFSNDRAYRYRLERWWDPTLRPAMFVGLNPSTANETEDDPTIRRCIRFAREWGLGGLVMLNLFALVSTDPSSLARAADPVGEANDMYLHAHARDAGVVIAAWGAFPEAHGRAAAVVEAELLGEYAVLGLTQQGHPRHPLYMRADCRPRDPATLEVLHPCEDCGAYVGGDAAVFTRCAECLTRCLHPAPFA